MGLKYQTYLTVLPVPFHVASHLLCVNDAIAFCSRFGGGKWSIIESMTLMNFHCRAMQALGWPTLKQKRYLKWRWMRSSGMTQDMKFIIKSWWVNKLCFRHVCFELLIHSWNSGSIMAVFSLGDVDPESVNRKFSCEQGMIFQTWTSFSRQGGKSHMRGNSQSSALAMPWDWMWSYGQCLSHSPSVMFT